MSPATDTGEERALPLRLVLRAPPPGVPFTVQRGATATRTLVPPSEASPERIVFDLVLRVRTGDDGAPRFLGPLVHGPPAARFVDVNAGDHVGDAASPWSRRAKIALGAITAEQVAAVLAAPDRVLVGEIAGTSRDGGPVCASTPLLGGWHVVARDCVGRVDHSPSERPMPVRTLAVRTLVVRTLVVRTLVAGTLLAVAAPLRAQAAAEEELTTVRFARTLGVDLARSEQRPSGLYVRDLRVGRGDSLVIGRSATLRLRTRLPDGTVVGGAEPFTLTLRPGVLVQGVEQGLRGMRVGARRQLVLPAALAYGERGTTGVPPRSPLVVDVEVLAAR